MIWEKFSDKIYARQNATKDIEMHGKMGGLEKSTKPGRFNKKLVWLGKTETNNRFTKHF